MDNDALLEPLAGLTSALARAEYAQISAMLDYRDAEIQRIEASDGAPMSHWVERTGVAMNVGHETGLSERQVVTKLCAAARARDLLPAVWEAFCHGHIDWIRVQRLSSAAEDLQRAESVEELDRRGLRYAETHTVAELSAWLRRFVARIETDLALDRAEDAAQERYVQVEHTADSMSWLTAYLPTHIAAAIDARLEREAKGLGIESGPDDTRTQAQRRADLCGAWLLESTHDEPHLVADIAVTLPAETLTGARDGFATSADGSWVAPASWILDHARSDTAFWHRLIVEPLTDDVLAHEYAGRFAPELLAKAIRFRDGVCRAPGCTVPADRCDLDHRVPHPAGPTNGTNMWALCRRHHALKGHGYLQWILPSGARAPAHTSRTDP